MDMEALSSDDYESVHRASRRLAARYGMVTLNAMMEAWEALVQDIEEGFDAEVVWEYTQMLRCRAWLAEAWPEFTDRIRAERQAELDALDARFELATVPLHGQSGDAKWYSRRPLTIVGDPPLELPRSWVL
ncbi:hypothetical protein J7E91_22620 [Streptomyces sp. ISL-99]|uniref:hypothetical protein n=1 Tax=Streptomyces sp. ISL-99 TaxID=2819193 RepID=UPI001BEBE725|nr:hypothetical protein [Streptomyces sp. ISL-99]MBT2528134.1 hypothetical protein [Streptomyces sp. ISL-99]